MGKYLDAVSIDFSGLTRGIQAGIDRRMDTVEKNNALKMSALEEAMKNTNASSLVNDRNNKLASEYSARIKDLYYKAYTYKMDEEGAFKEKKKDRGMFGPQITEDEYAVIMKEIQAMDGFVSKLRQEEQPLIRDQKIIDKEMNSLTPSGKIDVDKSLANINAYSNTGEAMDSYLVFTPEYADNWGASDDYYTYEQKQSKVQEPDPRDNRYDVTRIPGLPEQDQRRIYEEEITKSPNKQAGAIDKMVAAIGSGDQSGIADIMQSLPEYKKDFTPEDLIKYNQKILKLVTDFRDKGIRNPLLVDASITWGIRNKDHAIIGKELESRNYNDARVRAFKKDAEDKAKEDKENALPQGRPLEINGYTTQNAIHIGAKVKGLAIPEGAKIFYEDGTRMKSTGKGKPKDVIVLEYDSDNNTFLLAESEGAEPDDIMSFMSSGGGVGGKLNFKKIYTVSGDQIDAIGLSETQKKSIRQHVKQYKAPEQGSVPSSFMKYKR